MSKRNDIKPLACEYLIEKNGTRHYEFMTDKELSSLHCRLFLKQDESIESRVEYWSNEDMKTLCLNYNPDYVFPEHCQYNSELHTIGSNKRKVLAYIHNVVNPYVRLDNNAPLPNYSYLEPQNDLRWFSDSMVEHLQQFPIVGYGFPAYLAIHTNIECDIAKLYKYPAPSNWRTTNYDPPIIEVDCDSLFDQYYADRYRLYKAIHVDEYQAWNGKLKSKWEGEEAKLHIEKLDNTFVQLLLKQEQKNGAASSELLSLYTGKLDKYVGYFIEYLKGKLSVSKPQPHHKPKAHKVTTTKLIDIIQSNNGHSKEKIRKELHSHIDGKKNSDVGVVILAARKQHYLTKNPSEKMMKEEFGDIGKWGSVREYFNENYGSASSRADEIIFFGNE